MRSTNRAYLFAGLSVLLWSTVATSFKIGLRELDHMQLIFYASTTSVVVLFAIILIQGKLKLAIRAGPALYSGQPNGPAQHRERPPGSTRATVAHNPVKGR